MFIAQVIADTIDSAEHKSVKAEMATGCAAPLPHRLEFSSNNSVDAFYHMTRWLPDDAIIHTSDHMHTLTFPAEQLSHAKALWAITMYDGKSPLLIKNPINQVLITTPD